MVNTLLGFGFSALLLPEVSSFSFGLSGVKIWMIFEMVRSFWIFLLSFLAFFLFGIFFWFTHEVHQYLQLIWIPRGN